MVKRILCVGAHSKTVNNLNEIPFISLSSVNDPQSFRSILSHEFNMMHHRLDFGRELIPLYWISGGTCLLINGDEDSQ